MSRRLEKGVGGREGFGDPVTGDFRPCKVKKVCTEGEPGRRCRYLGLSVRTWCVLAWN